SGLVDAFQKKELDLALIERSLAHLRKPVSQRKNGREWTARADLAGVKTGTENRPVARFCEGVVC
ncbi:MAG: hypothetical protein J6I30_08725, partial [Pseudomonas sp.]|nr:hypothetical protein [Pseudomonas sp.]